LAAFAISTIGQNVNVTRTFPKDASYYKYDGAHVLNGSTVDTITVTVFMDKPQLLQAYTKTWFELVGTADTVVSCAVYGKVFVDDNYTLIDSASFSGAADGGVELTTTDLPLARFDSLDSNTEQVFIYPTTFYRYLQFRYIILGNDATGTGITLDAIEFKVPE